MQIFQYASRAVFAFILINSGPAAIADSLVVNSAQTDVNYGFFVTSPATNPALTPRWQQFIAVYDNIEEIDLHIYDQHRVDSVLTVWLTNASNTTLWSANFSDASLPDYGFLAIDTPKIAMVPGAAYRVNMTVDKYPKDGNPSLSVFWSGSTSPSAYFVNDVSDSWPTYSYAFQVLSAVPEPTTFGLMLAGIGVLALTLGGRKEVRTPAPAS